MDELDDHSCDSVQAPITFPSTGPKFLDSAENEPAVLRFRCEAVPGSPVAVEILTVAPTIKDRENNLPAPQAFKLALDKTEWILRREWQTFSEVYRVLNDLHARQRFTDMNLTYLPKLQLVAIWGKEPAQKELEYLEHEHGFTIIEKEPDENMSSYIYVIPANFSTAVMTGEIRILLEEELNRITCILDEKFQLKPKPGWTLAVSDCDQVCYYVERMLTMEQLMPTTVKSREEELSIFFGKNKSINYRRLERTAEKKRREQQMKEQQTGHGDAETNAVASEATAMQTDQVDSEGKGEVELGDDKEPEQNDENEWEVDEEVLSEVDNNSDWDDNDALEVLADFGG